MRIEPANIEQVRRAADGRMVLISKEASTVAADLARIDPGLKVRFAESGNPPFWAVYHESADGREAHLVQTFKASQTRTGVWTGLDDRIVRFIESIDPQSRSGYNFVKALDEAREQRERRQKQQFSERVGETGEKLAHAIRKDLGEKYKGRIFKPKETA